MDVTAETSVFIQLPDCFEDIPKHISGKWLSWLQKLNNLSCDSITIVAQNWKR